MSHPKGVLAHKKLLIGKQIRKSMPTTQKLPQFTKKENIKRVHQGLKNNIVQSKDEKHIAIDDFKQLVLNAKVEFDTYNKLLIIEKDNKIVKMLLTDSQLDFLTIIFNLGTHQA